MNKKMMIDKLNRLSKNSLYMYLFENVKIEDNTDAGLKQIIMKCDALTEVIRIKLKSYKKNKIYMELLNKYDINKLNEEELENLNKICIIKSEQVRLKLLKQKHLANDIIEL